MSKKHPDIASVGEIVETIFITLDGVHTDYIDVFLDELVNFCIDGQGRVRKALGCVACDEAGDNNLDYVPRDRYVIERSAWNSHSYYVETTLPNPIAGEDLYRKIRKAMGDELIRRLLTLPRNEREAKREAKLGEHSHDMSRATHHPDCQCARCKPMERPCDCGHCNHYRAMKPGRAS